MKAKKSEGQGKQLYILADRATELLRTEGIWTLPQKIRQLKDSSISLHLRIWPLKLLEGEMKGKVPSETILEIQLATEKEGGYQLYKIPEEEIKSNKFIKEED